MTTATSTSIPGGLAGTWDIDPVHSDVSFAVRHMMVSKVRGRFATFSGEIAIGEDVTGSSVAASIDAASVDTGNALRDKDLRSVHFFDVENHPLWTFHSTGVRAEGDGLVLDGDLTIKGVTRAVPLAVEMNGVGPDGSGGTRAGFSATTTIDRNDFGVTVKLPLDGGGVVVGDHVQVSIEIEAVRRAQEASPRGTAG